MRAQKPSINMKFKFCLLAIPFSLLASTVFAGVTEQMDMSKPILEEDIPSSRDDGWKFELRPYLWAVNLKGDLGVNGIVTPVDLSFGDILENLDMALAATFSVEKGPWHLVIDGSYLKLSASISPSNFELFDTVGIQSQMLIAQASIFRRIAEWGENDQNYFEVGLGARVYWDKLRINVDINDAALSALSTRIAAQVVNKIGSVARSNLSQVLPQLLAAKLGPEVANNPKVQAAVRRVVTAKAAAARQRAISKLSKEVEKVLKERIPDNLETEETWVDPVISVLIRQYLARNLYLNGYGDVGGFGVGSDITAAAGVGLGWHASNWLTLELLYRFLYVDYEDDGYVFDANLHGIFLGAVIAW